MRKKSNDRNEMKDGASWSKPRMSRSWGRRRRRKMRSGRTMRNAGRSMRGKGDREGMSRKMGKDKAWRDRRRKNICIKRLWGMQN